MDEKKCSKCKELKSLNDFYNNKAHSFGKAPYCKLCHSAEQKHRTAVKYPAKYKEKRKTNYAKNREKELLIGKEKYNKNKLEILARHKEWREDSKEYMADYHKKWYAKNREGKLQKNSDWEKNEKKNNPIFRLKKALRTRLYNAIKNNQKSDHTMILLGCSIEMLKSHIEKKFVLGMTWENYGYCWHVDHIKPCSIFDFSKEEEQRKCFHYTNLQPLFAIDNLKKYNKY